MRTVNQRSVRAPHLPGVAAYFGIRKKQFNLVTDHLVLYHMNRKLLFSDQLVLTVNNKL